VTHNDLCNTQLFDIMRSNQNSRACENLKIQLNIDTSNQKRKRKSEFTTIKA
jgi:hypothetical protein